MPENANGKKSYTNLIWLIVGVVILAWYFRADIATWTAGVSKPDYVMSAIDLMHAYDANEIAADLKYKDKVIVLDGKIMNKGKDLLNNIYVNYNVGNLFSCVQCFFADRYAKEISELRSGDNIRIKGRVEGKFGNVVVKGCQILKK